MEASRRKKAEKEEARKKKAVEKEEAKKKDSDSTLSAVSPSPKVSPWYSQSGGGCTGLSEQPRATSAPVSSPIVRKRKWKLVDVRRQRRKKPGRRKQWRKRKPRSVRRWRKRS